MYERNTLSSLSVGKPRYAPRHSNAVKFSLKFYYQQLFIIIFVCVAIGASAAIPNVFVLNPGNGATNQKVNLNVKAKQVPGAATYTIQLSTSADFSANVMSQSGSYIQYFDSLEYSTKYYARVKTDLDPSFGRVTSFTTHVPDVHLINPADLAINSKVIGNFTVKEVDGATSYHLEISKTSSFSGEVIVITSSTNILPRQGLEYSTTYYARAKTNVLPAFGKTTSFTTRAPEEDSYVAVPANGATNVEAIDLNVIANKVLGATSYTIEISQTADFTGEVWIQSTVGGVRTATFESLEYLMVYYARVKTNVSGYGITTSFTTRPEEIVYVLVSDTSSAGHDPKMTTLTIDRMRGASSYTLELSQMADFSTLIPIYKLSEDQFSFVLKDLDHKTQYYARAKSDISSDFGPTVGFTTRAPIAQYRLWGTTARGGALGKGTIFSYDVESETYTKQYDLPNEPSYWGALAQTPTGFYGLLDDPAVYQNAFMFKYDYDGTFLLSAPKYVSGDLMLASDNHLYVNTRDSNEKKAKIYKVLADEFDRDPQTIYTFPTRGWEPFFSLVESEGHLYSSTYVRGLHNAGTVYKIDSDGSDFEVLHNFTSGAGGWGVRGVIDGEDGYLYGMTTSGGVNNTGTIFKCKKDGSEFVKLLDCSNALGEHPNGKPLKIGNTLYGTMFWGGASNYYGVIFRINTDGSNYTVLKHFDDTTGENPIQGITVGADGILYGMTRAGGTFNQGVLFKIGTDGAGFQVLVNFNNNTGYAPAGNVLFLEDVTQSSSTVAAARAIQQNEVSNVALRAYPNPFNKQLAIDYTAETDGHIDVRLLNAQGQTVETIFEGEMQSGENQHVVFESKGLTQGLYLIRASENGITRTLKVMMAE